MKLALTRAQAAKEGFQSVVGTIAFGPSVAGEEAGPPLREGGADRRDHLGLVGVVPSVLFQLGQEILDLSFDTAPGWVRRSVFEGVKPPLQLDQPVTVGFEAALLRRKRPAVLHHGQQLLQQGRVPCFRLRLSAAAKHAKSAKTRRPPRAKGGLLPSGRVDRINSA